MKIYLVSEIENFENVLWFPTEEEREEFLKDDDLFQECGEAESAL